MAAGTDETAASGMEEAHTAATHALEGSLGACGRTNEATVTKEANILVVCVRLCLTMYNQRRKRSSKKVTALGDGAVTALLIKIVPAPPTSEDIIYLPRY